MVIVFDNEKNYKIEKKGYFTNYVLKDDGYWIHRNYQWSIIGNSLINKVLLLDMNILSTVISYIYSIDG
jgi:hypothetical protein